MSKPICTVMVGLPAMGKSTLVEGMYKSDTFIYSTDNILERIADQLGKTYDDVFEKHIKSATEEAGINLAYAIKEHRDIIWDQTNLGVKKRKNIINRMKKAGYQVRCDCIVPFEDDYDDNKEVWAERLASRPGKTIPENVLYNMMDSYVRPTIEEGFDMITFYNMHGALLAIDYGE